MEYKSHRRNSLIYQLNETILIFTCKNIETLHMKKDNVID